MCDAVVRSQWHYMLANKYLKIILDTTCMFYFLKYKLTHCFCCLHRTISLLGSFSENTDKNIFYTTLWGCIYSSATIRLPAVTFILTRLNKKGAGKQKYLVGNDIHVLVSNKSY